MLSVATVSEIMPLNLAVKVSLDYNHKQVIIEGEKKKARWKEWKKNIGLSPSRSSWDSFELKKKKIMKAFFSANKQKTRHLQQYGSYQDHQKYTSQKALGLFNNSKKKEEESFELYALHIWAGGIVSL